MTRKTHREIKRILDEEIEKNPADFKRAAIRIKELICELPDGETVWLAETLLNAKIPY